MWHAAVFAVLEILVILFGWHQYHVLWNEDASRIQKAVPVAGTVALTIFLNVLMTKMTYGITVQLNICCVYTLLCMIGRIDQKTHKIPNKLVFAGMLIRTALLAVDIVKNPDNLWQEVIFAFVGMAFGLGVMLLLCLLTRHGIGYGDVKLFAWLGYAMGLLDTYNVLFYGVLYAAIAGGYLMAVKKRGKKTKIPFAPFIFLGAYSVLIMRFLS